MNKASGQEDHEESVYSQTYAIIRNGDLNGLHVVLAGLGDRTEKYDILRIDSLRKAGGELVATWRTLTK